MDSDMLIWSPWKFGGVVSTSGISHFNYTALHHHNLSAKQGKFWKAVNHCNDGAVQCNFVRICRIWEIIKIHVWNKHCLISVASALPASWLTKVQNQTFGSNEEYSNVGLLKCTLIWKFLSRLWVWAAWCLKVSQHIVQRRQHSPSDSQKRFQRWFLFGFHQLVSRFCVVKVQPGIVQAIKFSKISFDNVNGPLDI